MKIAKDFFRKIAILIIGGVLGFGIAAFSGNYFTGQPAPKPPASGGSEFSHRQPLSTIDFVKLFPKLVTRQGASKTNAIALTFDDGPDLKYTPKILDTLKKYRVKATFFVIGTQIQKYPATFRRIIREGHEIASHGYQHIKISELPPAKVQWQLQRNSEIIFKNGGPKQLLFRPPYGALDPSAVQAIGKKGYRIILWTIDSLDWRGLKKNQVVKNVVPFMKKGYIVLQHSAADSPKEDLRGSIAALPAIITQARSRGFRFVTISQLLKKSPK